LADYQDTQFVQLLNEFHNHSRLERERLIPQRLRDEGLLSSTGMEPSDELCAIVMRIVESIQDEIVRSYRGHLRNPQPSTALSSGTGPTTVSAPVPKHDTSAPLMELAESPEVIIAFLDYLEDAAASHGLNLNLNPGPTTTVDDSGGFWTWEGEQFS
jgi:hypothetical protein